MYYEHFGLSGAPFEFNPSASVLFMSAGHREGLAALEWGLCEPSGFTMLVGEIGTGKTTLIYSLLATRHTGVRTAWVANPRLSFEEMLRQILGQLGVNQSETSGKLSLLQAFDAQLASLGPDECVAVIIDEAQDLNDDALEDLRLLSNFQSLGRRRLQIVLVGQIDLAKRLARPQLRQLNQRIGARALLPTLQGKEIYDYVEYRLRSRGGDIERLFTRSAVRELSRASGGIPRRINVLCHNALFLAYADGEECVTAEHVRDAAHDYDHLLASRASAPVKMAASASAAMQSASEAMRYAAASFGRMATPAASIGPAMQSFAATAVRAAAEACTFAALCLLGIAVVGFFELRPVRNNLSALAARFASQATGLRSPIVVERSPAQFKTGSYQATIPAPNTLGLAPVNVHDSSARDANELNELMMKRVRARHFSTTGRSVAKERQSETNADATVLVRAGDTLSKIAMRLYGSFGTDELSRLTAANPQIKDANVIYPGQSIRVQQAAK